MFFFCSYEVKPHPGNIPAGVQLTRRGTDKGQSGIWNSFKFRNIPVISNDLALRDKPAQRRANLKNHVEPWPSYRAVFAVVSSDSLPDLSAFPHRTNLCAEISHRQSVDAGFAKAGALFEYDPERKQACALIARWQG